MSSADGSRTRRRVLLALVVTLAVALVGGGAVTAVKLRANITVVDVNDALTVVAEPADSDDTSTPTEPRSADVPEAPQPRQVPGQPLNILVMGSDTREGQGDGFGSAAVIDGARSDTTMLVHLSADRQDVTVVAIPRDLVVTLPPCTMDDGTTTYPYQDRFNAAFSIGGPECTIRTVNALTGLPIHHFVVVDFAAFQRTIDALGGVEVCLTHPVEDSKAGLDLPAGVTRVDGEQALAFVRARETLGDGSDLSRIERQQAFLGSLVREATSRDLLTDPVRLIRSLDAATQSLTMDAELAWLPRAATLARSLAGVDPGHVSFVTLPYVYNDDLLTVRPDEPRMSLLVQTLAADAPWPFRSATGSVPVAPEQVSVRVVNATGRSDQAATAGSALALQGFRVLGLGTESAQPETRVLHPDSQRRQAETVASALGGAPVVADASTAQVTLVLGTDWSVERLRTVVVGTATDEPVADPEVTPDSPDSAWVVPDDPAPSGRTATAESSVCAS